MHHRESEREISIGLPKRGECKPLFSFTQLSGHANRRQHVPVYQLHYVKTRVASGRSKCHHVHSSASE